MRSSTKILLTISIMWVALLSLSHLYDFALKQNCNIKAAYIQNTKINADIIFHGPCVPLWMINPEQIDKQIHLKTYNLALSHSDFADNYLHLYLYLKNNTPPKYLFLYVTPESMDLNYNALNTFRFTPFIGDPIVDSVINEMDNSFFKWTNIPFMKYAYYNNTINFDVLQGLKHYFTHKSNPAYANGFEPPFFIQWDTSLEKFIQENPKGYIYKWSIIREKYLRKIIELAQKNNIKIYLYESPILQEALAYMPNRLEMTNKIQSLANSYSIQYIQFKDENITATRKYYFSALNTTIKGSEVITDSIITFIKKERIKK